MSNLSDIWKLRKRGQRDSERHKDLIKEAVKKKSKEVVGEYSIVKSDGDKKVKIPVKYLERYQFKYGQLNDEGGIGQNPNGKPGDRFRIGKGKPEKGAGKGKPGEDAGEDVYEIEMSIDELVDMLLEDMDLPWLKPTESEEIETEYEEYTSIDRVGIMPNLDIRKSLLENIKRNAAQGEAYVGDFRKEDLRYRDWEVQTERHSNAAVYLLMDRSGSMGEDRTAIGRSFFFWMIQFIKRKYKKIEIVFIAHDTAAKIMDEDNFFKIMPSGGTLCSSALKLAYEHMSANHPPEKYSNYVYHISDGDNLENDFGKCKDYVEKLSKLSCAIGYAEVNEERWGATSSTLHYLYSKNVPLENFVSSRIDSKEKVFDALKEFFTADKAGKKNG